MNKFNWTKKNDCSIYVKSGTDRIYAKIYKDSEGYLVKTHEYPDDDLGRIEFATLTGAKKYVEDYMSEKNVEWRVNNRANEKMAMLYGRH
jgi:hypothetical protein